MIELITKPAERFTNRVDDYDRYRPGYPAEVVDLLEKYYGADSFKVVADIGSGTGIFAKLFLDRGYTVYGVEPNGPMRQRSQERYGVQKNFIAIDGSAEQTTLENNSVGIVTAAQAFHWFNKELCIPEFKRILKEQGVIMLVWNERNHRASGFMTSYERLLKQYCPLYGESDHSAYNYKRISELFRGLKVDYYILQNMQQLNFEGVMGRLKSCSYCPKEASLNYKALFQHLKSLYDTHHDESHGVQMHYETIVYAIHGFR